jgi:hypothetical protein
MSFEDVDSERNRLLTEQERPTPVAIRHALDYLRDGLPELKPEDTEKWQDVTEDELRDAIDFARALLRSPMFENDSNVGLLCKALLAQNSSAEALELHARRVVDEWLIENRPRTSVAAYRYQGELRIAAVMEYDNGDGPYHWNEPDYPSLADQLQPGWGDET